MREFQRLSLHGPAGCVASEHHRRWRPGVLPADGEGRPAGFNAYHHGGKVNGQDHEILRGVLRRGGAEMPGLRALIATARRVPGGLAEA